MMKLSFTSVEIRQFILQMLTYTFLVLFTFRWDKPRSKTRIKPKMCCSQSQLTSMHRDLWAANMDSVTSHQRILSEI